MCEFTTFAYVETQNPVPAAKGQQVRIVQVACRRKEDYDDCEML
jgi:hypothetical protein